MSRLFGPIFQIAYVIDALEPALDHWTGTLGIGPFFMFPTPLAFDWLKVDGALTDDHDVLQQVALAYSGDTMIELLVPTAKPSTYRSFLDSGRRGVHHLGTVATDYDAQLAAARAAGIAVALEGELPLSRFAYLATDSVLPGTMIEIIDMRPGMVALFGQIKAASVGWDGKDPVRAL